MKYQLNTSNYHTFSIFAVNKLPARSYFIPYPDRAGADAVSPKEKRYRSSKVLCLNGQWDFKFYPRPAELPAVLDTDAVSFDKIDVPACWQFRGYDRPFYVNIRYQFPYKPPVIPTTEKVGKVFSWLGVDQKIGPRRKDPGEEYNFVGVYRRFLTIGGPDKNYVMVDHAVLQPDGGYTYGGDHGEWEHDGNFCVDGLFYPDRQPSAGAKIIKFIYRPIRVAHQSGDRFEIFNTMAFSSASRYELSFQ